MTAPSRITILDSTLRDGAQGQDISFSVNDKLRIVELLDAFGLDFIEAGNPGSNQKDAAFFERAGSLSLKNAQLCSFGATRRCNTAVEEDENIQSLLAADTPVVVIFGKSSLLHVTEILKTTPEENLRMISETVAFLKARGKTVIFDAEHYFDGYFADARGAAYALSTLAAACSTGADIVVLCDTNGGMLPSQVFEATCAAAGELPASVPLGIHAHNDSGCAVANSLMALEAGATHVQGTFIGFGERCGNADLTAILPAVKLKMGRECAGTLERLSVTANAVAEISNVILPSTKPYVGASAFAHKAGMHTDGVLKNTVSFEHIDPASVGNERHFLVSEVAGRTGVLDRVRGFAPELAKGSPALAAILERLKALEYAGYQFEAADASFELMAKRVLGTYAPHFMVTFYKTMGEFPAGTDGLPSTATIEIEVDGRTEIAAAKGRGPVHALDSALRKALVVFYPQLNDMQLVDYKVRVLEQKAATAASVRVLIESTDGHSNWTTIGVSDDILEASFTALVDSLEYKLAKADQD
ncbi:MAG: citramalate synthase [Eggerthellaceae bacterium]|nr:citramalate synthase [Eggerthellaceae bacterium]